VIYANGGVARITVGWRITRGSRFRIRFDVIHVHGGLAPTLGWLAPIAAMRAGIPVVATSIPGSPLVGYRLLRRPLQRMLDRHARRSR